MARKSAIEPLKSAQLGDIFLAITLDTRVGIKSSCGLVYPIAIRIYDRKSISYFRVAERFSIEQYCQILKATGRGRTNESDFYKERPFDVKARLLHIFDSYISRLNEYNSRIPLTRASILQLLSGKETKKSFYQFWTDVASSKSFGTAESYSSSMKSFKNAIGDINGFNVPSDAIKRWVEAMSKEGKSKTTIGIYLRACRVIWKAAQKKGYISKSFYPFGNESDDGVIIPRGATRKSEYLNVAQMTELYDLFTKKEYPSTRGWGPDYTNRVHVSLGLFLIQYLCNGFNLADAAQLTYDDYYYLSGGKAFRFFRKKTKERNAESSEVIIPITEELQFILEDLAAKPEKGQLVFPFIVGDAGTPEQKRDRVKLWNSNVQDRLYKLTKELGWNISPSGTWARHSFASNLSQAGVPHEYISESMGHSTASQDVTSLYIAKYPLEKQFEYNRLLLDRPKSLDTLMSSISKLSADDLEMLRKLLRVGKLF